MRKSGKLPWFLLFALLALLAYRGLIDAINPKDLNHLILWNDSEYSRTVRFVVTTINREALNREVSFSAHKMHLFNIELAWIDPVIEVFDGNRRRLVVKVHEPGRYAHTLVVRLRERIADAAWLHDIKWNGVPEFDRSAVME